MTQSEQVAIRCASDIVLARSVARKVASQIGFGLADQTRLATAVSELARNVVQYGGDGFCRISNDSNATEMQLRILIEDHGPGIADLALAMKDGYSTGGGLGAGLPGTRRLMGAFAIESQPGMTRINIALIRRRA